MKIQLTASEVLVAQTAGFMRRVSCRGNDVPDRQRGKQDPFDIEVQGVIAEMAVAKAGNLYPDLTVSARSGGADLVGRDGKTIDVKSTDREDGQLLGEVKKKDSPSDIYVLVLVRGWEAEILGWAYGDELMDDRNLTDLGHGPVYALPQNKLRRFRDRAGLAKPARGRSGRSH